MLSPLFVYGDYHAQAAVTATDSKTGTFPVDILQAEEDNCWRPANVTGSKILTFDFYLQKNIGAIGIVGDYLNGVSVSVYGSNDNFASQNVQLLAPVTMVEYQANVFTWTNRTYRYACVIFSGHGLSFAVAHVAFCNYAPLPFLNDGLDPKAYKTEGEHIISPEGIYIGSHKSRTMLNVTLDFGQVTSVEFIDFQAWADVCLKGLKAFFYVPDSSSTNCYFVWSDKPSFSATWKNGLRNVGQITLTGRVV